MLDPLIRYSARHRRIALPVALLLALVIMSVGELAYALADTSLASVRNRYAARYDAQLLRSVLTDAETGQRGFLLTGREAYLVPMNQAAPSLAEIIGRLKQHYQGSEWDTLVGQLNQRVLEKLSELNTTVSLYRRDERSTWLELVRTDIGKEKMDAVRVATARLEAYESERITTERSNVFRALNIGRFGVHALALLTLVGFACFLRKNEALDCMRAELAENVRAERDRLDREVHRRTEDLTELARHLTSVREDERSHLARELHDELGALLTAAKLDIARIRRHSASIPEAVVERLAHMGNLIDEGITLKRRIIEDLRPSALSNLGMVPALEILTREFGERSGLVIHTELLDVVAPDTGKLALYRLVQEALTNVLRHANAQQVWVSIQEEGPQVVLSVRDDGQGFAPQRVPSGHHGLLGMRYRIEALGGVLQLTSALGQGTEVEARLPYAVAPEAP
ncbi:CHASE3 domain-containing protein [Ideonella margarita]|uniref:histidine kinase n=1 Tax=Ideonella margarita TaxID=2984191 RepID=A0ABU9C619_9BURK